MSPFGVGFPGVEPHAARPAAEDVQQARERLGVADLAARDHLRELGSGESAHLFDQLALVQMLRAPREAGRDEQVDALVVPARHRVPLGEPRQVRGLVSRLLHQLSSRAGLRRLERDDATAFLARGQRARGQLPQLVGDGIAVLPHEHDPVIVQHGRHHADAGRAHDGARECLAGDRIAHALAVDEPAQLLAVPRREHAAILGRHVSPLDASVRRHEAASLSHRSARVPAQRVIRQIRPLLTPR